MSVEKLELLFDKVISKLKEEGVSSIKLDMDYYRFIPADQWEIFEKDTILVGSLVDDFDSLELLLKNKNRPCSYVDFDRLANILKAISQTNNPL